MGSQSQRTVVAVTTALDDYQTGLLAGARRVFAEHGIALVAHTDSETPQMPATLAPLLRQPTTCGAILLIARSPEHETMYSALVAERDIPVVRIGQAVAGQACVRADNVQGMTELMALVLDGCKARAPALIRGMPDQPDHVLREQVFRTEIARRGMCVDEDLVVGGVVDLDPVKRETRRLLARRPDTDAVVTMHDWCALVAIEACLETGMRVPQDVVVTGFDNYAMPSIAWPGVTTVDQNLAEQGATAARIILDGLAGTPVRDHVSTRCTVIPRGSTAVGHARDAGAALLVGNVSRLASQHLKAQDDLQRMNQVLMRCNTLDDICDVLPESLWTLGITRAFLVLYEAPEDPPDVHGVAQHVSRLVLDYRDGGTHPVPNAAFSSRDLLPEHLRGELHRGFLGAVGLEGSGRSLGHMFLDLRFGPVPIVTDIKNSVSRTLEVVSNMRALSEHSRTLERLVTQRSRELMSEISVRQSAEQELRRANAELQRMGETDGLTKVANRTALDRHFAEFWQKHVEEHATLTVLLVDVDHFKAYNDRYGHQFGDEALRTIASCLTRAARYPDDLVCRFGGEEFLVVLPFSTEHQGLTVARRFLRLLAEAAIAHSASPVAPIVTASVGIASVSPNELDTPDSAIATADKALYLAKREGRNRIRTRSTVVTTGSTV